MKKWAWRILLTLVGLLFLTGCSTEIDVWLHPDESWKVKNVIILDPSIIPGLKGGKIPGLGINIDLDKIIDEAMQFAFDQLARDYRSKGIKTSSSHRKVGDLVHYELSLTGKGLASLRDIALVGNYQKIIQIVNERFPYLGTVPTLQNSNIVLEKKSDGQYYLQMRSYNQGIDSVIRVHTGKIIQSNAYEESGNTATWYNPGDVEILFEPYNPWLLWLAIGVPVVLLAAGLVIFLLRRPRKSPGMGFQLGRALGTGNRLPPRPNFPTRPPRPPQRRI